MLSQNFDGVTAPALPAGWTNVQVTGTAVNWVTTTTTPNSAPNAAFASNSATVNATALVSPAVTITSSDSQLTFRNQFNTESGFDGVVLEYTTNGGTTWTDVITGGGSFVSGGYTGLISTVASNQSPIVGRQAWTGNSNGYITSTVSLPASLNGQSVQFRWLIGTDNLIAATGAWVDDVQVLGARVCQPCSVNPNACAIQRRSDFNGDGLTDYAVFRPSSGVWYVQPNGAGSAYGAAFGAAGDRLHPADYDGDNKSDFGVVDNAGGLLGWYVLSTSGTALFSGTQFGQSGDIVTVGNYDADAKADLSIWRPSIGTFAYRSTVSGTEIQRIFGAATDIPTARAAQYPLP